MYVLYNNKYYLTHNAIGQWTPTPELSESFQFNDKTKADNALANLPKQMRNLGYFVQQVDAPSKPLEIDGFDNLELANYDSALAQIDSFCDLHDQLDYKPYIIEQDMYGEDMTLNDEEVNELVKFINRNPELYMARDIYRMAESARTHDDAIIINADW